jgi:hypothetical protein
MDRCGYRVTQLAGDQASSGVPATNHLESGATPRCACGRASERIVVSGIDDDSWRTTLEQILAGHAVQPHVHQAAQPNPMFRYL